MRILIHDAASQVSGAAAFRTEAFVGSRGLAFRGFRLAVWGGSLGASGALLGWSQMEGIQRDFPYCCKKGWES